MLKDKLIIYQHRRRWRRRNPHNMSVAVNIFNLDCVNVGKYTYGGIRAYTYDVLTKLNVGNYCSIGPDVSFIVSAEHNLSHISSYPFKVKILGEQFEGVSKGNIAIDDDVWIGCGATILSGVHIHQGAVIAAGAVVDRDVEPYAIVGGVPAKVIRYRFDQTVIDFLLTLDYGKLNCEIIQSHADELYKPIDGLGLDDIKKRYSWFPKRSRN